MLYPSTIKLIDEYVSKANLKSRNEFIENSIKFYVGYLRQDSNINYLNKVIDETLLSKTDLLSQQISHIIFKLAIEINLLATILAATTDIDRETLKGLRFESINEIKQTSGKIDLEEIFKSYSMKEGD